MRHFILMPVVQLKLVEIRDFLCILDFIVPLVYVTFGCRTVNLGYCRQKKSLTKCSVKPSEIIR